jgi:riboflavin kinase / FMN adenylyltransferase
VNLAEVFHDVEQRNCHLVNDKQAAHAKLIGLTLAPEPSKSVWHPMMNAFLSLRDPDALSAELARPVLAIGNFDGMHLGHAALLHEALCIGKSLGRLAAILTFEPHPRAYFQPDKPMFRLTPPDLKAEAAAALGAHGAIALTFDAALAAVSAQDFVQDLILGRFGASGIVVGHDFHFGKGRQGNPALLAQMGHKAGIDVTIVQPLSLDGIVVSSSHIRNLLSEGDIAGANRYLGREWLVRALVTHGDKRGRLMGYPTANLMLDNAVTLKHGIYAVRAVVNGVSHAAVASFGRRPTFDDGAPKLEVHLFDFAGDLYGQSMDVAFVGYIRPELKFDGVEPLIRQMDEDSLVARKMLKSG